MIPALGLSCLIYGEPLENTAQEITGPQASQIEQWVAQSITAGDNTILEPTTNPNSIVLLQAIEKTI
jgi:hypothetical protein